MGTYIYPDTFNEEVPPGFGGPAGGGGGLEPSLCVGVGHWSLDQPATDIMYTVKNRSSGGPMGKSRCEPVHL